MRLALDPIACQAHHLCAELLPERITLDDWGYPMIDDAPLPPELEQLARRAAAACPTLALRIQADRMLNVSTQRTARSRPTPAPDRKVPRAPRTPRERRAR